MSVEGIRQLLHEGTAVSTRRAGNVVGFGMSIPASATQSGIASIPQDGSIRDVTQNPDAFSSILAVAQQPQTLSVTQDTSAETGTKMTAQAAFQQSQGTVQVTVRNAPVVEPLSESVDWESQVPIASSLEAPLVEQPGQLAATGNVEADELTSRVLSLRLGRGLPADAAIRDVASAQTLLIALGHDVGAYGPYANGVDGVLGPVTSQALLSFQREQGMAQTGTLTAETAERLQAQGQAALERVSADWQAELAKSPFDAGAYLGTANPFWYVRFVAESGDDPKTMGNIDSVFKGRLAALARDAGRPADFGEGFRTVERQAWFYQRYLDGTGALAAKPGQSRHNMGLAVDTQSDWLQRMDEGKSVTAQTSLQAYGLCKPLADGEGRGREPWHIEPLETRG